MQAAAFYVIHVANVRNARTQISDALEIGSGVFRRLLDLRGQRLIEAARLLSADYAFKSAYGTGDPATILSALENHRGRIGADIMMVASLDYEILADTRPAKEPGGRLPFASLLEGAVVRAENEITAVVFIDSSPYQMVVVPMLTPMPDAWICVGFLIEEAFATEFRRTTLSHISLMRRPAEGSNWAAFASTLPASAASELPASLARAPHEDDRSISVTVAGEEFVTLVTPLLRGAGVVAVLQRPLAEALRPYLRLRLVLVLLFSSGAVLCFIVGTVIARSVSRSVLQVAQSARKVEEGDYSQRLDVEQRDEIGQLAASFNHMVRGLEERDRVRDLLGKVVSPEIAQQLLQRGIDLGGEEREVTILFSDVRGFTSLSENRSPHEILALLNAYLTRMSGVVEANGGVVDKYVGDMIMALFGAPIGREDDAARAVRAALDMRRALAEHNAEIRTDGIPPLEIGVGVNTARVVAGNMGSMTRLNYTVIGDGVNLGSRIESLTKYYGVPILVSETTRAKAPEFIYREIDRARVKGKTLPVTLYEPLGTQSEFDPAALAEIHAYHAALEAFRARRFREAGARFESLRAARPDTHLYRIYIKRIEEFTANPPPPDWDGAFSHTEK